MKIVSTFNGIDFSFTSSGKSEFISYQLDLLLLVADRYYEKSSNLNSSNRTCRTTYSLNYELVEL